LISQTHLPKVVVVNDNSTDKTAEIVLAFARQSVYLFSRKDFKCNPFTVVKLFRLFKGFETLDDT
jgi:cellulose synthase/poly-beta-1,6-N-acetylglucosamine synthase-like glycosyltransferase